MKPEYESKIKNRENGLQTAQRSRVGTAGRNLLSFIRLIFTTAYLSLGISSPTKG
jgi:hypothetical protein